MKKWLFAVVLALVSTSASAQTVLGATPVVTFTVASDYNAVNAAGQPVVASYELQAIGMNGIGAVVVTVNLGKPIPDAGLMATASVPQLLNITPNVTYTATVAAIGASGARGVSAPSNPFLVIATAPLGSPVNVRVR